MHYFHTKINNEIDILKQGDQLVVSSTLFLTLVPRYLGQPVTSYINKMHYRIPFLFILNP